MSNSKQVSAERFVRVWMLTVNYEKAAEELGVTKSAVSQRVMQYRKKGIKLPLPRRDRASILDVKQLNSIIAEYR